MKKFKNKYRIQSARHPDWDYSRDGSYFVTICTSNRECFFGDVKEGEIILSEIGNMVDNFWLKIPEHFPFVKLDVHVIMPNHVHGIVVIDRLGGMGDDCIKQDNTGNGYGIGTFIETPKLGVSTAASQKWNPGSLGVIINQYKRICTINVRKNYPDFGWQSRFHDHIIRDDSSLERIRNYIINNPGNWKGDEFFR